MLTIAGLGSECRGDDTIGLRLAEALQADKNFREIKVKLWDSLDVLTLANNLLGCDQPLIILDCMNLGKEPGSFGFYASNSYQIKNLFPAITNHGPSFGQALALAMANGFNQKVHIFGVQPDSLELGMKLSVKLRERFPEILAGLWEIIKCLKKDLL